MKITSRYTARNDVVIPGTGVGDTEPSRTVDTAASSIVRWMVELDETSSLSKSSRLLLLSSLGKTRGRERSPPREKRQQRGWIVFLPVIS